MKRTLLSCTLLAVVLSAATAPAENRPNILFIHMEDMGVQIPAYGDRTVATPNLDKLAAEGVVFERAHVTAATCAASRGSLFSGMYPHQNGIMGFVSQHGFHFREGVPTFAADLKAAGYRVGITYKDGVESSRYKNKPVQFDFHPMYTENWLAGLKGKDASKAEDEPPLASFSVDNFRYFVELVKEKMQWRRPFWFVVQSQSACFRCGGTLTIRRTRTYFCSASTTCARSWVATAGPRRRRISTN